MNRARVATEADLQALLRRTGCKVQGEPVKAVKPVLKAKKARMNKTEGEFLFMLRDGVLAEYGIPGEVEQVLPFESIRFKVGAYRAFYTPDLAAIVGGRLMLIEVKGGFSRAPSRCKFQAAALQYPCFRWIWAQKKKGVWKVEETSMPDKGGI